MSTEHFGHPHEPRPEEDLTEELLWRNNEVRKYAKDLRLNVEALPEQFPNRAKVLHMIADILELVPVLNPEDEAIDEQDRRELADSITRGAEQFQQALKSLHE